PGLLCPLRSGLASHSYITRTTNMKRQINPTIKAHLVRSAFYVLLLLAVCVIPFALAQSRSRGTAKQSAGQPTRLAPSAAASALATKSTVPADAASSGLVAPAQKRPVRAQKSPRQPSGDVLWYNGDFNGVNGLANEPGSSIYDNFIVPSPGWHVTSVFSD